mgnify:CR=1 FL=1
MNPFEKLQHIIAGRNVLLVGAGPMPYQCEEAENFDLTIAVNAGSDGRRGHLGNPEVLFVEANVMLSKRKHYAKSRELVEQNLAETRIILQTNPGTKIPRWLINSSWQVICHHQIHDNIRKVSDSHLFFQNWDNVPSSGLVTLAIIMGLGVKTLHMEGFSLVNASHNFEDPGHEQRFNQGYPARQHSRPDAALLSLLSMKYKSITTCNPELTPLLSSFEPSRRPNGDFGGGILNRCYC